MPPSLWTYGSFPGPSTPWPKTAVPMLSVNGAFIPMAFIAAPVYPVAMMTFAPVFPTHPGAPSDPCQINPYFVYPEHPQPAPPMCGVARQLRRLFSCTDAGGRHSPPLVPPPIPPSQSPRQRHNTARDSLPTFAFIPPTPPRSAGVGAARLPPYHVLQRHVTFTPTLSSSPPVAPHSHAAELRFWRADDTDGWLAPEFPAPFRAALSTHGLPVRTLRFASVTQYVQARKALLFGDGVTFWLIADVVGASDAETRFVRALGHQVQRFDEAAWARAKGSILVEGCRLKFAQNAELRARLGRSRGRAIVYARPQDFLWGIGYAWSDAPANAERWGSNMLGKVLEDVRRELHPV